LIVEFMLTKTSKIILFLSFLLSTVSAQETTLIENSKNIDNSYHALLKGDYTEAIKLLETEIFENANYDAVPYYAVTFCVAPDGKKPSDKSWRKAIKLAKKAKNNWGASYEAKYFKKIVKLVIEKADNGNAVAQYRLGDAYMLGKGVKKNVEKAVKYMKMAADQGLSCAQQNMGLYYGEGEYVDQDLDKAISYLEISISKNHRNKIAEYLKKYKKQKSNSNDNE